MTRSSQARRLVGRALRPVLGSTTGAVAGAPLIGLTYDDGPDPHHTPAILDELARHGVRATFFVLSQKAVAFPHLIRRMREEGHEVGLHGTVHQSLIGSSPKDVVAMVREGRRQLETVLGQPVLFFRPPYGDQSLLSYTVARLSGLQVVCWSVSGRDWQEPDAEKIIEQAFASLRPGGILLLHDAYEPSRSGEGLPPDLDRGDLADRVVGAAKARGWELVPVGELLHDSRPERRMWIKSLG